MKNTATVLPLLALTLFAAPRLEAQWTLDPQPDYLEFRAEPAARADGGVLLTWTRQREAGAPFSVLAATLDPVSGQLGEAHEWGEGQSEQAVALATGYLAVRQVFAPLQDWIVERLDASGRVTGAPLSLGRMVSVAAHPVPGGGAVVVGGGVSGTGGGVQAWKFGPDGALLAGPVTLAQPSLEAAAGVDAAGNLVLVWTDPGTRLFARRFSPALQPLGPVESVALGGAFGIRVAVAPDGRFVVVYDQRAGCGPVRSAPMGARPARGARFRRPTRAWTGKTWTPPLDPTGESSWSGRSTPRPAGPRSGPVSSRSPACPRAGSSAWRRSAWAGATCCGPAWKASPREISSSCGRAWTRPAWRSRCSRAGGSGRKDARMPARD